MAPVTICSDSGAQENSLLLFPLFPHLFAMKWWDLKTGKVPTGIMALGVWLGYYRLGNRVGILPNIGSGNSSRPGLDSRAHGHTCYRSLVSSRDLYPVTLVQGYTFISLGWASVATHRIFDLLRHVGSLTAACELWVAVWEVYFPDKRLNQGLLHWELRVLATESPGKSPIYTLDFSWTLWGCQNSVVISPVWITSLFTLP